MNARAYVHYLLTGGRIFVYGTLMRGEEAHAKLQGARFVRATRTRPGYSLRVLGRDFEGLAAGDEAVPGELYEVSFQKVLELDRWEYDIYVRDYVYLEDGSVADAYLLRD